VFSRSDALKRHIASYCKTKNIEMNLLKEENEKLKLQLAQCDTHNETNIVNTTNNTNNTNNTSNNNSHNIHNTQNNTLNDNRVIINNNNNINVNMVTFGRERLEMLTEEEKLEILKGGVNAILRHMQIVHFNERLPQYMNIYRTNLRDKTCDVYDCGKWRKADLKKMVELRHLLRRY